MDPTLTHQRLTDRKRLAVISAATEEFLAALDENLRAAMRVTRS